MLLLLVLLIFAITTFGNNEEEIPFKVWAKQTIVCWPSELEQFVFIELPNPNVASEFELKLTLPEECKLVALPTGKAPTLPEKSASVFPVKYQQNGNVVNFEFAAGSFGDSPTRFLTLSIDVRGEARKSILGFEYIAAGKVLRKAELPVKIYPALSGIQPQKVLVAAYAYPGLDKNYLPVFMNMLRKSGVNAIYQMRGESNENEATAADFAENYNMKIGLVFFIHHIRAHVSACPPLSELLDKPDEFKKIIKQFFADKINGKPYTCVIYDAEAGGLRNGKILGDTSSHALNDFKKYAQIPSDETLTLELLKEKYSTKWVDYICEQSNRFSRLMREFLDENYPEMRYEAYSGYELDQGPMKNRTRELYGTDWKTMSATGIDAATAVYHGSMAQIRHTANATKGKAPYIPAEMYVENFNTKNINNKLPEVWASRLIKAFMNGDRKGITLWYANNMDGAALIGIDRLTKFITIIEDFALNGKLDNQAVSVRPEGETDNVFVLRQGGNAVIILLNDTDVEKTVRLNLVGFRVTGFTGELGVTDLVSGKLLKASKIMPITIDAFGYRILQLMDDGN